MTKTEATVYAIDDDASVRRSLKRLLGVHGFKVELFSCAAEFLALPQICRPSCLILDIQLPDKNGMNFHQELVQRGISVPIIFITGHGDIAMSVKAMKAGAVDFLTKPFGTKSLFESVERALAKDAIDYERALKVEKSKACVAALTPREREVFLEVIQGKLNKQIAHDLGIALKTVKIHRGNLMRKMKVQSVIGLAQIARDAGLLLPL